jgi:hypothetical protein
MTFK